MGRGEGDPRAWELWSKDPRERTWSQNWWEMKGTLLRGMATPEAGGRAPEEELWRALRHGAKGGCGGTLACPGWWLLASQEEVFCFSSWKGKARWQLRDREVGGGGPRGLGLGIQEEGRKAAGRRLLVGVKAGCSARHALPKLGHACHSSLCHHLPLTAGPLLTRTGNSWLYICPPLSHCCRSGEWGMGERELIISCLLCDHPSAWTVGTEGHVFCLEGLGHKVWSQGTLKQQKEVRMVPTLLASVEGS